MLAGRNKPDLNRFSSIVALASVFSRTNRADAYRSSQIMQRTLMH